MKTDLSQLFGLIHISGNDAKTFIQNQLSNDVELINTTNSQISSYNSPKGRVYAIFRVLQTADSYLLITSKNQIDFLAKRLSMFVLRSDVKITDVSEQYLIAAMDQAELKQGNMPIPSQQDAVEQQLENYIICIPGADNQQPRYILISQTDNDIDLDDKHTQLQSWLLDEIKAGMPHIFAGAEEQFVAQMLNLDLINGINFQKGCYPGQEIIARMKYLGKLKKRLFEVALPIESTVNNAQAIYLKDKTQSIGQILYAANDGQQHHALAVLNIEATTATQSLTLEPGANDQPITIIQSFAEGTESI